MTLEQCKHREGESLLLDGPGPQFGKPPSHGPCRAGQQHAPSPRGNPAHGAPPCPEGLGRVIKGTVMSAGSEVVAAGPSCLLCLLGSHQATLPGLWSAPKKDRDLPCCGRS